MLRLAPGIVAALALAACSEVAVAPMADAGATGGDAGSAGDDAGASGIAPPGAVAGEVPGTDGPTAVSAGDIVRVDAGWLEIDLV